MVMIIANPCPILATPCNRVINPKIIDDRLIIKHLDERFMVNLGIPYHDYNRYSNKECSDKELIDRLTVHSYDDRLEEKKSGRYIRDTILLDFIENDLKGVKGYMKALQIVYDQELMKDYLSNYATPIVADWPGQFYIRKAIMRRLLANNKAIPQFVMSILPMMGPLHVSLNSRKLVFDQNWFLFNDIYHLIFGESKNLGKNPQPWKINLILHIMRMAWVDIVDVVYLKFSRTCKAFEFLYLTDLLNNLIPLVLDIYAVHHWEGNWPAYEEACMRCWCDLFLRFDRRNYKHAPLMFFSDVFYWMAINYPMYNMLTNNLESLSNCPVEIVHSVIRRRTAKYSTAQQLQKEAHCIFQNREDSEFQQHFVTSKKYPYTPKQLNTLSRKCATKLLDMFAKIYQAHHGYPSIIQTSSNGINTYKLPSLDYEIMDRHLPRGFVMNWKPNATILCDYVYCYNSSSIDGIVLTCGHGYHNHCLQRCQFKCLICLGYLQGEVKKNIDALLKSLMKEEKSHQRR
ncbi:hypothetical protein C2G38_2046214 [Gigaspora rosea]|uniref:Uncharacterized protein n=1 Tax=Gigaspora rosea TaxID=44941 RepID=A0A397UIL9_9GLOM|nr:hypothetical protein C2G38_2046214 [Gigaspora rosea]